MDLEVIRSFAEGDIAIGKEGLCARGIKEEALRSASRVLTGEYSKDDPAVAVDEDGQFVASPEFVAMLMDDQFRAPVLDLVEFAFARNARDYADAYKDTDLVLNRKYTREEACRLLGGRSSRTSRISAVNSAIRTPTPSRSS